MIRASYYKVAVHQILCKAGLDWWKKYQTTLNKESLLESLRRIREGGKDPRLKEDDFYADVCEKAKKLFLIQIIGQEDHFRKSFLEFIQWRAVETAAVQITTKLLPERRMEEILKVMREAVGIGLANEDNPVFLGSPKEVIARQSWRDTQESVKVSTGLERLNKILLGGLGPGELGVILAGPSRGKTSTLVQLAMNAVLCSKKNVFYVSREQDDKKIGTKMDCFLLGRNKDELKKLPRGTREKWAKVLEEKKARVAFKRFKRPCTAEEILMEVRQMESRDGFKTELIVIDYADKMKPSSNIRGEGHEQIGAIYQEVFDLSQELWVPIWTASQSTRAALYKATVDLDDLGESYKKAHIADVIVALCQTREEFGAGNPKAGIPARARLFIAKNRDNDARATLAISVDYATATWKMLEGDKKI